MYVFSVPGRSLSSFSDFTATEYKTKITPTCTDAFKLSNMQLDFLDTAIAQIFCMRSCTWLFENRLQHLKDNI